MNIVSVTCLLEYEAVTLETNPGIAIFVVARNGLWNNGHPYVCIVQAVVIANYKFTSVHEYH